MPNRVIFSISIQLPTAANQSLQINLIRAEKSRFGCIQKAVRAIPEMIMANRERIRGILAWISNVWHFGCVSQP
jgi:hypothetical protein